MSMNRMEQKFSEEMDARIDGAATSAEAEAATLEYRQLLELGQVLAGKDFSEGSNRSAVLFKVRRTANQNQEENILRTKNKFKRPAMMLATVLAVLLLSVTIVKPSFAQEILGKVLQTINLGHIIAHEVDYSEATDYFPEELKGKVFDKDGNPLQSNADAVKSGALYNAAGEKVVNYVDGKMVTQSEQDQLDKQEAERKLIVREPAKLSEHTRFQVGMPSYVPEGYVFDRGEFYKGENGTINGKYANVYFTNEKTGKEIIIDQRFADKETAYEMSFSGKMEQVKINGADAVLKFGKHISVDWEADGILYSVSTLGLDSSEVIKIAESIK